MATMDNNGPVEIYLASIWQYHDAGVKRVLEALRKVHPSGQFTFEAESSWFKVSCKAGDVHSVQSTFRAVHIDIERSLNPNKVPTGNQWIKPPSPSDLPKEPASKTVVDQLCPVAFDQFAFRKVWARVKTDTPDTISVHKLLSEDDRKSIMATTGTHMAIDMVSARLVYIGAETRTAVAKASKMLDNLFSRFIFVMPPPKHLLYAETDGAYHVDARYMAHVNDTMLTSTIFDPSQYPTEALLEKTFKSVFAKGVCLRICEVDLFKRIEVSLFGPRSEPIFNDQARKWPMWFKRAEYTPKILGVTAPKKVQDPTPAPVTTMEPQPARPTARQPPQQSTQHPQQTQQVQQSQVEDKGNELVSVAKPVTSGENKCQEVAKLKPADTTDLLGLDLPDTSTALSLATSSPATSTYDKPTAPAVLPPMPPSFQSDKYSYQMKLLWDFMNNPLKISPSQSTAKQAKLLEAKPAPRLIEAGPAEVSSAEVEDLSVKGKTDPKPQDGPAKSEPKSETVQLIDFIDDAPAEPTVSTLAAAQNPQAAVVTTSVSPAPAKQDDLLIEIDNSPPRPASPSVTQNEQTTSITQDEGKERSAAPSLHARVSKALVRRSTFTSNLCNAIGRLMADLPYSRGRIKLQVELGRVYIMDANPEGLAFNMPGEAAAGWPQSEITTRLDTICVSPESIVFSRALTLFANDIESVLGISANATAQSLLTNGSSSILDGDVSGSQSGSLPEWSFHEKRIVYEFKCQRLCLKSNGVFTAISPFVIEVDGTEPGAFTYAIRSVEDTRPPIWIHCIRRHWDARVSVSYSQSDKLEAEYGGFARELLRSLVVPPCPITNPKFQFSYDHRETKKDSQSYSTMVLSARIRNVGRFVSADQQSFLDVSWNMLMSLVKRQGKDGPSAGTMHATPLADNPTRGMFTSWYEASLVSAEAEAAFQENEALPVGEMATWGGVGTAALDDMYESAFRPALRLVQKMDGVGVLVDNGQSERQWMPPMKASQVALAVQKFW
ncbi:hypothetical protein SBRCBS47491_002954 [Sporothrix bragantina]|uniref:Uncharacterized protein n=1 Tax=Sporothrix bragantina TaxID=671064 RepID=A0ABP0BBA3_9PEZI